jgi:hypothetical protein
MKRASWVSAGLGCLHRMGAPSSPGPMDVFGDVDILTHDANGYAGYFQRKKEVSRRVRPE